MKENVIKNFGGFFQDEKTMQFGFIFENNTIDCTLCEQDDNW